MNTPILHLKVAMVPHAPVISIIVKKWNIHYTSLTAIFNLLRSSMNPELLEKYLCSQRSHYEKYRWFLLHKGSHHVQPLNQCFSLSAKMNGRQRQTLVSPWRMQCMYCSMPKDTSRAEGTLNSKIIKPVALAIIKLCLTEGISQAVSQSVENSVKWKNF